MGKKILIVAEEHADELYQIEQQIGGTCQLIHVHNGNRALQLAQGISPHIAIVSRSLSDTHGVDFLCDLGMLAPKIPTIFIAENPTTDLVINAFRAGADDFLSIPFSKHDLVDSIKRLEHKFSSNQELEHSEAKTANRSLLGHLTSRFRAGFSKTAKAENKRKNNEQHETQTEFKLKNKPAQSAKAPHLPSVQVQFLGPFKVTINDTIIKHWSGKKAKLLFAYLAYQKRPVYRDVLMEKFWPDADSYSARNCLNVTLHQVRSTLQAYCEPYDFILFKNDCYQLNPDLDLIIDVRDFLHHWGQASSLYLESKPEEALTAYEAASSIYKGDFIEEELYEPWIAEERESLREIYLTILDRLSDFYSLDGKPGTAITLCNMILKKDNYREDVHQRLMICFDRVGLRDRAIKQYEKCTTALEELEIDPSQKTREIYKKIKKGQI